MSTVEAVLYGTHVCNSQRPMRVRVVRVAKLAISFLGITLCVCVCVGGVYSIECSFSSWSCHVAKKALLMTNKVVE
mgnify:CR=1 FL=1